MDSERGYRRLVKNVNRVFSSLWEHEAGYEVGRAYELAIVAVGPVLRGFLDGVPMFVVEDEELATGRVGLYCWGDADARFARVQVFPAGAAFDDQLLDKAFDTVAPGRWTVVDEGDVEGPSDWQVSGSELRQTANIHGGRQAGAVPSRAPTSSPANRPGATTGSRSSGSRTPTTRSARSSGTPTTRTTTGSRWTASAGTAGRSSG